MKIDVWLYGPLSKYGGDGTIKSHFHVQMELPEGTKMGQLLGQLKIPDDEKGISFINALLADLPGLKADHEVTLHDGDRVGIFSTKHMWPYQYRSGAMMTPELEAVMKERGMGSVHHTYNAENTENTDKTD